MICLLSIILAIKQFDASSQANHPQQKHLEKPSKKCSFYTSSLDDQVSTSHSHNPLLVFISFSVPLETWKEHSYYLQKVQGAFVLRGIPQNSFEALGSKIIELRKAEIQAEVILDPQAFEKYDIQLIPTILLRKEEKYDKIAGNISLPSALSLLSAKGDNQEAARGLLLKMQGVP